MREDWVDVKLGQVLIQSKEKHKPEKTESLFYVGLEHIEKSTGSLTDSVGLTEIKTVKNKFVKGQILYGKLRPYLNKVHLSNGSGVCSTDILVFEVSQAILGKFALLLMISRKFVNDMSENTNGVNLPRVSTKHVNAYPFQIPPLPEQRAIVAKIEELFSDLDKGLTDLKKAQDQLKVYRQAVLSSSFPKEKSIEISKLVFNLSQGWSPKCINQNSTDETQWAVIKTSAIQAGRFLEFENKILPEKLEPREQHEIKKGDILITRAGPRVRVGVCCLVRNTRPKLINCDKVYRLEIDTSKVDAEYFEYAMNSPEVLSEIEVMKSGTSDSGLNLTQKAFLKLKIPYVEVEKQPKIVREIESRLSVCDKVEQSIIESLEKAKALRQSILKKAFEGTLLSEEEIATCKAAPDYEPASVLLERIRKEKKK